MMGYIGHVLGLYWGYVGIMEKQMETALVYWVYVGIMEVRWKLP